MDKSNIQSIWARFKDSPLYKIGRFITNSAAIALLITAVLFVYQEHEERARTEKIIHNLQDISTDMLSVQQSLSTRYLGIFPNYIQVANDLLQNCSPKDSIIVFEDVLYYGYISKPEEFVKMNNLLLSHADDGGNVTIVYYNEDGRTFHRMVREALISSSFYGSMENERRSNTNRSQARQSLEQLRIQDTLLCNKYFTLSDKKDPGYIESMLSRYLQSPLLPLCKEDPTTLQEVTSMCARIDSVRTQHLGGKTPSNVSFFDFENMNRAITKVISSVYLSHGVDLWPMDEYLTMSCWLAGEQAVLAFPSKWSSDEIGFFSQDPAFARYIKAMFLGVKSSL